MNPFLAQIAVAALALVSAAVPILAVECIVLGWPLPRNER